MRKVTAISFAMFAFAMASTASAQTQTDTNCTTSPDYGAGRTTNCTSTSTSSGPTAAQVEQQKQLNQNMSELGGAIGQVIARKRAENAALKGAVSYVVYCRQNPKEEITTPEGKTIVCEKFLTNSTKWCVLNAGNIVCKEVAKLGPWTPPVVAATTPTPTPVVVTTPKPAEVAAPVVAVQPVAQPTPAPVVEPPPEVKRVDALPTSVAEAARQARIAKAIREAKEKAERDNPPPPQQ